MKTRRLRLAGYMLRQSEDRCANVAQTGYWNTVKEQEADHNRPGSWHSLKIYKVWAWHGKVWSPTVEESHCLMFSSELEKLSLNLSKTTRCEADSCVHCGKLDRERSVTHSISHELLLHTYLHFCHLFCSVPSGRGPAYSGSMRWGLFCHLFIDQNLPG